MSECPRGLVVVLVASLLMACGGDSSVAPEPPATSGGVLPGDAERNPQNITILWRIPGDGATVTTEACGYLYVLPLEMGVMARHDEVLTRPWVFVELFNAANKRCAYGLSGQLEMLPASQAGTFVIRHFGVAVEDVPSSCRYPAAIAVARATLLSGSGGVGSLPHHAVKIFPMTLQLTGSTDPLPASAGPCRS